MTERVLGSMEDWWDLDEVEDDSDEIHAFAAALLTLGVIMMAQVLPKEAAKAGAALTDLAKHRSRRSRERAEG